MAVSGNPPGEPVVADMDALMPPGGPLFDLEEAAEYLGVSLRWMTRAVWEHRVESAASPVPKAVLGNRPGSTMAH